MEGKKVELTTGEILFVDILHEYNPHDISYKFDEELYMDICAKKYNIKRIFWY